MRIAFVAPVAAAFLFAAPTPAAVYPARVQVTGKEVFYALSRGRVVAGPAIVEFVNYGEDAHDMRIERVGGTRVYKTPVVQPGTYYDLSLRLVPGRYELWCSIANHRALGMRALLVVRPR